MKIKNQIHKLISNIHDLKEMQRFFVIFYAVGILGLSIPVTFPIFLKLIPFAILLSAAAIPLFHEGKIISRTIIVFTLIFILAFTIEAIGVRTGTIFGSYEYGGSLGVKLFDTPLIIGLNWVLLVYLSSSVLEPVKIHNVLKIIVSSVIMLIYDVILEQLAGKLDMWQWKDDLIPLQNYHAWFIVALIFNAIVKFSGIRTINKLSWVILICQIVFFLALLFILK